MGFIVDRVAAVVEFTSQEILKGAGPYRAREQVFADGCGDIIDLKAGFVAGGQQMMGRLDAASDNPISRART
jgi:hypothetical protein